MPTATPPPAAAPTAQQLQGPTDLPPEFTQSVSKLAAEGHLIAYAPFNQDNPAPAQWEAGKLFQIIPTTTNKVTPILALGKHGPHLLAITIHPTTPTPITLDQLEALAPVDVLKTPLSGGNNTVAGATKHPDPKPFITKQRGTTISTIRALPIQPHFLHHYIEDNHLHHPATLHGKIANPPTVPHCDPTALWLQCATTKHRQRNTSSLAITTTTPSTTLNQRISDTIRNDFEELLSHHATPLITWMEQALIIAPTTAPPPAEEIGQIPPTNTAAPTPPGTQHQQAPPPTPQETPIHPEPHTRRVLFQPTVTHPGAPPPTQPSHTPQPTQPTQPTQPPQPIIDLTTGNGPPHTHTTHWQPPHATTQQWTHPTWNPQPPHLLPPQPPAQPASLPNPGYPSQPLWNPYQTHHHTIPGIPPSHPTTHNPITPDTRHQPYPWPPPHYPPPPSVLTTNEMAQKHINALLAKPTMTADDISRVHTFTIIKNATQSQTQAPSIHSERIYPLLGFAGLTLHHTEFFHQQTGNAWRDLLAATSKAGRETKIITDIIPPLRQRFPSLHMSLHQEWIKAIASFDFTPQPLPPGDKPGLGPMAYVARTRSALHAAKYQQELIKQASHVSTEDIAKAKLNTPIVPRNCAEVIVTLQRMLHVLQFLFTNYCPLAVQLATVIRALEEDSGTLSESPDFQWNVAAEIMWQVTVAAQTFFGNPRTKLDHQRQQFHQPDLSRLHAAIRDGTIIKSLNKAPMFCRPQNQHNTNRRTNTAARDTGKRRRTGSTTPQADQPTTHRPTSHVANLNQECKDLVSKFHTEHRGTRLPSIAQIRQLANVECDADLITHLGLQRNDCIRYQFYGRCSYPGCARTHVNRTTSPKHTPLLTKAIANAIASKS